jgi:hypothetical protein
MLRILCALVAMIVLMLSANFAAAGDWWSDFGNCDNCYPLDFPPYWIPRVHKFRPLPRDGAPLVTDRRLYPEGYNGVGCIWTWRVVATPHGPRRVLVPDCVSY